MGESNTHSRLSTTAGFCDNALILNQPSSTSFHPDKKQNVVPAIMMDRRKEQGVVPGEQQPASANGCNEDPTTAAQTEAIPEAWQMPCHKASLPPHHQVLDFPEGHRREDQVLGKENGRLLAAGSDPATAVVKALSRSKQQRKSSLLPTQHQAAPQKQQRRNSSNKRVRRSSDHHKRASSSSNNSHYHHYHHHHDHHRGSGSKGSSSSSISSSTDPTKTFLLNKHQHHDRVVRTDEIALFMRCKKRYSDPDFKPIPPAEGGWELVKPDRVVSWEKTAENYIDFSSYLSISRHGTNHVNETAWKSHAPWVREIEQEPAATGTINDDKQQQRRGPDASKQQPLAKAVPIIRPPPVSEIALASTTLAAEAAVASATTTPTSSPFDPPPQQSSFVALNSSVEEHGNARLAIVNPRVMSDKIGKFANPLFDRNQQALWETRSAFLNTSRLPHGLDIKVVPSRRLSQPPEYTLDSGNLGPWSPSPVTPPFTPHDWATTRGPPQHEWTPPISPWSPRRHESYDSSFLSSSCSSCSCSSDVRPWDQAIWEDRFASIMKVVDDDPTPHLKSNGLATTFTSIAYQEQPKSGRASIDDAQQLRARWGSTTLTSPSSSSPSDGMVFLVANSQLLQNMVQTGSMGCRHCGSGTHAVARDCPHLPVLSVAEAWLALHNASLCSDVHVFMEALDVYSKAHPTETLQSIAKRLQDNKSTLQLVALDTQVPSTTLLIDLQGIPHRRYTAIPVALPNFDNKGNTIATASSTTCTTSSLYRIPGMSPSADQNLTRLAEAGIPRDLTEMAHCRTCKQSGHWVKDCVTAAADAASTLNPLNHRHPHQQHENAERHQDRYTNTSAYDYSPRRFSVNANTKRPDPTGVATAAAAAAAASCHRLYYNLDEYVLVDAR